MLCCNQKQYVVASLVEYNRYGGLFMSFIYNTTEDFTLKLASSSPVPGGGGASALVGAVGASLASMVGNLTTGKKKYAQYEADIQRILSEAEYLRAKLMGLIDEDAACFEPLSMAYSLPKESPDYGKTMEDALKLACTAPMDIMKTVCKAIELHNELLEKGSKLMLSDVGVGVLCCKAALMGASLNVYINIKSMKDAAFAEALKAEADGLLEKYCSIADETYKAVAQRLI